MPRRTKKQSKLERQSEFGMTSSSLMHEKTRLSTKSSRSNEKTQHWTPSTEQKRRMRASTWALGAWAFDRADYLQYLISQGAQYSHSTEGNALEGIIEGKDILAGVWVHPSVKIEDSSRPWKLA